MDISDISFHCIDEASDNEADEELNADYYRRTARVNDENIRFSMEIQNTMYVNMLERRDTPLVRMS